MKRHYPLVALVSLLLALFAFSGKASATTIAPPSDYAIVTANGQFIFVMLLNESEHTFGEGANRFCFCNVVSEWRAKYPQSGLYKNDGSTQPLWTVGWYDTSVDVSSDGRHLLRWGGVFGQFLTFYEDGKPIKGYWIEQLVRHPELIPLVYSPGYFMFRQQFVRTFDTIAARSLHKRWFWSEGIKFDDAAGEFTLTFTSGERYVFDISTGEIVLQDNIVLSSYQLGLILRSDNGSIAHILPVSTYNTLSRLTFAQDTVLDTFSLITRGFTKQQPARAAASTPVWTFGDWLRISWRWTSLDSNLLPSALSITLLALLAATRVAIARQPRYTRVSRIVRRVIYK